MPPPSATNTSRWDLQNLKKQNYPFKLPEQLYTYLGQWLTDSPTVAFIASHTIYTRWSQIHIFYCSEFRALQTKTIKTSWPTYRAYLPDHLTFLPTWPTVPTHLTSDLPTHVSYSPTWFTHITHPPRYPPWTDDIHYITSSDHTKPHQANQNQPKWTKFWIF